MSRPSRGPGPRSIVALRWLTRVGTSPGEPLALVMGWSDQAMYDHVARLQRAGLLTRIPMTRGDGSLFVVTRAGARLVNGDARGVPRAVGPTTWAYAVACAWIAAWFEVRGRVWRSSREIARESGWQGHVTYEDGYGRTQHVTQRPDLGTYVGEERAPVAVEVELQPRPAARLRGELEMYWQRTLRPNPELAGVLYITTSSVTKPLRTAARAVGLGEYPHGYLRILALEDITKQTRDIAREQRTRRLASAREANGQARLRR